MAGSSKTRNCCSMEKKRLMKALGSAIFAPITTKRFTTVIVWRHGKAESVRDPV